MDQKNIFLNGEADAFFQRNKVQMEEKKGIYPWVELLTDYMERTQIAKMGGELLEIGACYGRNLKHFKDKFGLTCYGIEPSVEAVNYGNEIYKGEINMQHGTSDVLPYEDEKFDIVILGFCMFFVDRKDLMKSVAEADRVLKENGYLIITDFDTKMAFKRENIHNPDIWTYKLQYSNLFLANPQYFLVEKRNYSIGSGLFCEDIQERMTLDIIYKDSIDNAYIKGY